MLRLLSTRVTAVSILGKSRLPTCQHSRTISLQLPERYKGTVVEKWYLYWKNLFHDYREVAKDTIKDVQQRPIRAAIITSGLGFATYCVKNNPDEQSFRAQVLSCAQEVSLVGEDIRNNEAVSHLKMIEGCYNAGLIRRLSLGVCSIMWIDNYNNACGLFEARCSYTTPSYFEFHKRILDVGFLNNWWLLEEKMKDYDMNPLEWQRSNQAEK